LPAKNRSKLLVFHDTCAAFIYCKGKPPLSAYDIIRGKQILTAEINMKAWMTGGGDGAAVAACSFLFVHFFLFLISLPIFNWFSF